MAKKELNLHAVVSPTETVVVSAYDEDGFEERSLEDIKAYIHEMRAQGLILGDKYISHDLVPSFYLAD